MQDSKASATSAGSPTFLGHPSGLFMLFFAEMWERFSYYGMRALLVFYMIKGFMQLDDSSAYGVYGAYGALVYATPFIGGMLADRLLGARRAVVLGGLLMAAGHFLMTVEQETAFYTALALLICGNGFFKPNISTIVGSLYEEHSPRRDGGFTLFYMGINLGAAMSPVVCGYVGETFGWHYGFGLATLGMLIGVAIFIAPTRLTQGLIMATAIATAIAMPFWQDTTLQLAVRLFLGLSLVAAATAACIALSRGGLPADAGAPPDPARLRAKLAIGLRADLCVYLGVALALPLIALLVQRNEIAGITLAVFGGAAFIWLFVQALRGSDAERKRMFVVLILMFFSMLFWAFFEQAGSSLNNFADRNVDRVFEERTVGAEDVGQTLRGIQLSQEQLGHRIGGKQFLLDDLSEARDRSRDVRDVTVDESHLGMGLGGAEIPASEFQAANPVFILLFGLLFSALWSWLGQRGREPSTPVKFALGLLQLGLGFVALWYGAQTSDERGMVGLTWLLLGYLLHTTGELCLSPVGLSMVTKLSPKAIVSTVMGAWFLATAFSNYLAGLIATLTGVGHGGEGGQRVPAPIDTVDIYGDVFGKIALTAIASALVCFALSPMLSRWMAAEDAREG